MAKKTLYYTAVSFFALIVVFAFPLVSSAIGQTTEPIVIDKALRGQEITERMTLINSNNAKIIFQVKADGAIKDWVTFYNLDNMQVPITEVEIAPVFYHDVYAVFKIPTDLPNGTYKGTLDALVAPEKNTSDQSVSINMKVSRSVAITISDEEVVNIETTINPVSYVVKSGEPAQIRVIYKNTGNITVKPDIQLKIFDKANKVVFNAIFPFADGQSPIKSGERREMPLIEWQTSGQPEGDYLVEATPVIAGRTFKTEPITFTLKSGNQLAVARITNNPFANVAIIAVAIIGLGVLVMTASLILKKRKTARL